MRSISGLMIGVVLLASGLMAQEVARKTSPVLLREVKPQYTEDAKARKVEGSVEVKAVVLADGNVGDVTVTKSLDPDLDEQAIKATKQWKFRPGTVDGKPVDVEVNIELTFTLRR